jgi:hypothetical protein
MAVNKILRDTLAHVGHKTTPRIIVDPPIRKFLAKCDDRSAINVSPTRYAIT